MAIRIYSTPSCGYCKTLKAYLEEKKVAFEEVDITKDPAQAAYIVTLTGQAGVPVLVVDTAGQPPRFVVGFVPQKVNELLGLS